MSTVVYSPAERPDCEVRVEGRWVPAEVRMWQKREDGWHAKVTYQPVRGENRIDTFHEDDVRRCEGGDARRG